jgi:hypothetical protein
LLGIDHPGIYQADHNISPEISGMGRSYIQSPRMKALPINRDALKGNRNAFMPVNCYDGSRITGSDDTRNLDACLATITGRAPGRIAQP